MSHCWPPTLHVIGLILDMIMSLVSSSYILSTVVVAIYRRAYENQTSANFTINFTKRHILSGKSLSPL